MSQATPSPERTEAFTPRPAGHSLDLTPLPPAYPFLRPPAEPGEVGRLANYRVLRLLGSGGMGMVFAAEDVALHRPVALKVMNPELAGDPANGWQRFLREARALAGIKHPNLVTVYQAGEDGDTVYLAMELLEGESLESRIRRAAPPPAAEVVRIATGVAAGLDAVHGRGLIHRDIKPANIWLEDARYAKAGTGSPDPTPPAVKLLDFGLVRAVHEDTQLTESGMVVGTPAYMSPEQVRGRATDHRTDLFSLGCVVYALCTGRPPFDAENAMAQAAALAADDPPPVRELNPAVPAALSDLVDELLAKEPGLRPQSAAVVIERLRRVLEPAFTVVETAGSDVATDVEPAAAAEPAPETEVVRAGKSTRRMKKTKGRKRRPFLRRHALKLVAGLCVVAAGVAVAAFAGGRGKDHAGAAPAPTPPVEVFLTDLKPVWAAGWPSPPPPGFDGTVAVGRTRSPHGIFLHPMPPHEGTARITYRLDRAYTKFRGATGFNDSAPPDAPPVRFVVLGDGDKELWGSSEVRPGAAPRVFEVDVTGVGVMTIAVLPLGPHRGAHAVWVEPRLTR